METAREKKNAPIFSPLLHSLSVATIYPLCPEHLLHVADLFFIFLPLCIPSICYTFFLLLTTSPFQSFELVPLMTVLFGCPATSQTGAYLHILWNIGGIPPVLACMGSFIWLLSTPKYEEACIYMGTCLRWQVAAVSVEGNLIILGALAIEDKLQRGVPDAVESLRQAEITVWVSTRGIWMVL